MYDPVLAFERYRLEVVRGWPEGAGKTAALAEIQFCLAAHNPEDRKPHAQAGELQGFAKFAHVDRCDPVRSC